MKGRLNVTIKNDTVLKTVYTVPKTIRGKLVETALTQYFKTPEWTSLSNLLSAQNKVKKTGKTEHETSPTKAKKASVKSIMGGF